MAHEAAGSPVSGSALGRSDAGAGSTCPCGGVPQGASLAVCCGPILGGDEPAPTAEALMRSRYTAYALGDADHLFRSWHARTRPDDVAPDPRVRWVGLSVLDVVPGGEDDTEGVVEFRAQWVSDDGGPVRRGEVHERSRFVRR